jgi:hypothetical protein
MSNSQQSMSAWSEHGGREGVHAGIARVSVAKALGAPSIQAIVAA